MSPWEEYIEGQFLRKTSGCFQLFIFSFLYLSVTIGFTIAFVVGFGAADTTDGLYATFSGRSVSSSRER